MARRHLLRRPLLQLVSGAVRPKNQGGERKAMAYRAPAADIVFALKHAAGFAQARAEGLYDDVADDLIEAVLGAAGRFASEVVAPLNAIGDRFGTPFKDGSV